MLSRGTALAEDLFFNVDRTSMGPKEVGGVLDIIVDGKWDTHEFYTVYSVVVYKKNATAPTTLRASSWVHIQGTWESGEPYVVFPFVVFKYGAGVSKSKGRQPSASDLYLSPVALPRWYRKLPTSIHTICFTPTNVDSTTVLDAFIEDIREGPINGVKGIDPNGNQVRIYLLT